MLNRNKKVNDLNEGKWIGIGGKVEEGESLLSCIKREVKEETGLCIEKFTYHGVVHFRSDKEDEEMYLYTAVIDGDEPKLIDCNEGSLAFIDKTKIYDLPLWEGDKFFLDKLIAGKKNIEMTLIYEGDKLVFMDGN